MVELRKRKPSQVPAAAPPPPAKKKANPVKSVVEKAKAALTGEKTNGTTSNAPSKATVGETISLDGFGGDVETQDGVKTSLKKLVDDSKSGVVLFTYPKASTPGCTTQACLFRDSYTHLTSTGLDIYGLSNDSPKANTTFKTKQSLPYPLLCDPSATLISAIGLKKAPKGTTRGVFVIDKSGKVLASEPGGPQATVDVVANLVQEGKVGGDVSTDNAATAQAIKTSAEEAPVTDKEDTAAPSDVPAESTSTPVVPPAAEPATNSAETSAAPAPAPTAPSTLEEPQKMDEAPLRVTPSKEEEEAATTASEVAETAAKLDGTGNNTPNPTKTD